VVLCDRQGGGLGKGARRHGEKVYREGGLGSEAGLGAVTEGWEGEREDW
jgi:hypothetical protein